MRVKWNRHLDGSSSRRQEDGSEGAPEEIQPSKEKNKHSSPSIFRIFRRKKSRQRPDSSADSAPPTSKSDLPPFLETPAPSEADEDDCASISSVATCASQPVNEVCHRDRTLSLFSSFRLNFPKKKKKRATESSDGKILDNRFSSPDLRRHPSDNVQPLSSSSQSVPNTKDASKSLRCLEELRMENSESLGKLKCPSSETKLVKSVSFSECKLPSPCSRLPIENIDEMTDKSPEVNGIVLEANLVSCFSARERKNKLLSGAPSNDFIPERQSGISDMLDSHFLEKNESSEVSNKMTCVAEVQPPDSCFEIIPSTITAKSFQNNCNSIDYTHRENTGYVFPVLESGVISTNKSELTRGSISQCVTKDDDNCDLNTCVSSVSAFKVPTTDCDLCGEQNIQVKHDINSNKVLEDDKCLVNTMNYDKNMSSEALLTSETRLLNKASNTDSNIVLPDCKNESCNQTLNTDSTSGLSKSKDKSFCEISGADTNFVFCESDKCIVPSKSNEDVNVKNGVKSIPDSFDAGERIDCDASILNTLSMCKVKTENECNNIAISDLCNGLKTSKLSGTVFDATVGANVDSETSSTFVDYDVKLVKESENDLRKVQPSDALPDENVNPSFSKGVKVDLNADTNFENSPAAKNDVVTNSKGEYFDEKFNLPRINVNTLDLIKNSLFNFDKFLLSCSEQLLNNIPLFDFSELFENRQKSLLSLNGSFIYPDIVNFPNIFPDTESYLEQLAKCRNPNSFFMGNSEIPRRYFCSAEVKNFNINGKYSTPFENDSSSALVETATHQGVCLSNNKREVTSQFSDVCSSDNLPHAHISDRMDNSESAMNNGEENGEDVAVRGKNRCQERCPEFSSMDVHLQGFATVVTHRDSDLRDTGSIDTPGNTESSNEEEIRQRCVREVSSEPADTAPAPEMLSSVSDPRNIISITVPSDFQKNSSDLRYNGTVDNAIYSRDEITGRVGKPGVICDSLVYKRCKAGEGLGFLNLDNASEKNNLDSDKRFEKSRCVLAKLDSGNSSNISRIEYSFSNEKTNRSNVHSKEVSLPFSEYAQQSFTLNDALEDFATTAAQMDTSEVMKNKFNTSQVIVRSNIHTANDYNIPLSKCKKNQTLKNELEGCAYEKVVPNCINYSSQPKLPSLVQNKNLINRNKNSMIPCKTSTTRDAKSKEFCSVDSKVKSKKSGLPMDHKTISVEQNALKTTCGKSSHLKNNNARTEHELAPAKKIYNAFPKQLKDNIKDRRNSLNDNSGPVEFMVSIKSRDPSGRRHSESPANVNNVSNATNTNVLVTSSPSYNASSKTISGITNSSVLNQTFQVAFKTSNPTEVRPNILNREGRKLTSTHLGGSANDSVDISAHQSASVFNVFDEDASVSTCSLVDAASSTTPSVTSDASLNETFEFDVTCGNNQDATRLLSGLHSSCSSLPAVIPHTTSVPSKPFGICLERNSLKSDVISQEKSRIPKKQAGPRGAPNTTRPVRPPMWLSKAELTQEIQRLSSLCEIRTKELNRLKMETKHVSMGFDAFSALFKYLVEDLSALSVPHLTAELGSTLKKLELTKQDLAYYEREVEEIKAHHRQELNDLSNKLFEVFQTEVAELNAKHQEEINQLNDDHQKQIENLSQNFNSSSEEIKAQHEKLVSKLEQELLTQREEMRLFQEREIKDLEEKHTQGTKVLQEHIEQLQKKCAELKQHSMSMEDAMRKDTDSKLQWVTTRKVDLEKEVESLKAVLEMKNKELHSLRIQNLEMEKQLEELPFAREKIKMLQARAEDLEALMNEKTKQERKLSSENQLIRDTYEKESKVNRRLSMENEELQWRLRLAEQSLLTGSFAEVDETREETDDITTSSTKGPAPQILSKSVFFTFVDKDESSASPRTPYKRITPGFSSNYKTSPGKLSRPSSAPSPRKAKSHSEPPLPPSFTSTPRKMSKHGSPKSNSVQKRQKSEPEGCHQHDETEIILSVTESMTSSASSENSVQEHKERLLEEHKEQILATLEIIREQQSSDNSNKLQMSQSMIENQVSRPSNFETDMSRSAEFADPKSFYHMTFPVLKEPGTGDGDTENSSKVSSCNSSKDVTPITTHSISESSLNYTEEKVKQNTTKINVSTAENSTSGTVDSTENKPTKMKSAHSMENFQNLEANNYDVANHHWRTI